MTTASGVYSIPAEDYHADKSSGVPRLSSSLALILLEQSPLHCWHASPMNRKRKRKEKAIYDLGNAAHAMILEGDLTNVEVISGFGNWQKKEAQTRRALARMEGKFPLLDDEWEALQEMAAAMGPQLARLEKPRPFTDGKAEQSVYWTEDGIECRGRLDWLRDDHRFIDDLKSGRVSANPDSWTGPRGQIVTLGHDVEAAFHCAAVKALFGVEPVMRFIVCENTPPYALSMVALGPDVRALAERKMRHALNIRRECLAKNEWPGYPTRICWAELAPWQEADWMEREAHVWTPPTQEVIDDGRDLSVQLFGEEDD